MSIKDQFVAAFIEARTRRESQSIGFITDIGRYEAELMGEALEKVLSDFQPQHTHTVFASQGEGLNEIQTTMPQPLK
jgi:hypothetical protein